MIRAATVTRSGEAGVTAVAIRATAAGTADFAGVNGWPPGSYDAPGGQTLQHQRGHRLAGPRDRLEGGRRVRIAAPGDNLGDEAADVGAGQELVQFRLIGEVAEDGRVGPAPRQRVHRGDGQSQPGGPPAG